jgi:probable rRNA maturation factor
MKKERDQIQFHYLTKPFYFPGRNKLKSFILRQLKKERKKIDALNYVFCDDAYLLQINKEYLRHNTFTDIITFELSLKKQPLLADIYISVERVKENSGIYNTSFKEELLRVIFHGILHLVGFRDKTEKQATLMRRKEDEYLRKYYVSRDTVS